MDSNQNAKLDMSQLLQNVYSEDHVESVDNKYIGESVNGERSGFGILLYSNGNRYLGQFKDNNFCGEGIFYFKNGDLLQGNFFEGLLNGLGRYKSKDGYEYYGYWVNGRKTGWGRMRNQTVWMYDSETYKPEIYDGHWLDDEFHGEGLYENHGNRYYGMWVCGVKSGYGKLTDGEYGYRYEGDFLNDEFEGRGQLTFHDKSFYSGFFKNGKPDGHGYYQDINGIKHIGEWKNGYCEDLLNQYIKEIIEENYSKEFDELKFLRLEWDLIFKDWEVQNIKAESEGKVDSAYISEIRKKLLNLDVYLADFDELMEERVYSTIHNFGEKNIKYYCCDFSLLAAGEVPDPYEALIESIYYESREVLYRYYRIISDALDQ